MDRDLLIGGIALGVIIFCTIALIVLMVKKIVNKIKGESPELEKKPIKQKKAKEKVRKPRAEEKRKTGKHIAIPNREEIYNDQPIKEVFEEVKEETDDEDDDDETLLMRKRVQGVAVQFVSDTTGDKYSAVCEDEIIIGRKSDCGIQIKGDKSVSSKHCMIRNNGAGGITVLDIGSSNGTYLNDEKLVEEKRLESGDTLEIGRTRFTVQIMGV